MRASPALLLVLAFSGCLDGPETPDLPPPDLVAAYDGGRLFSLIGCDGMEVVQEWVGAHGPHGPRTPPPSWRDGLSEYGFSWSLGLLRCDRIGWGPLERGPVAVGLEVHNAYKAPERCVEDLDEATFVRYVHAVYLDDPDGVDYARSWGMPAVPADFTWQDGPMGGVLAGLHPDDAAPSTVDLRRPGAYDERAVDISVAFFWFDGERVQRLTLNRQTHATFGDVAVIDMAPPSIMGDLVGPRPASASWLSGLHWTGELVSFQDHECSARVGA